jgi:hypothetical protein
MKNARVISQICKVECAPANEQVAQKMSETTAVCNMPEAMRRPLGTVVQTVSIQRGGREPTCDRDDGNP